MPGTVIVLAKVTRTGSGEVPLLYIPAVSTITPEGPVTIKSLPSFAIDVDY